MFHINYKIVEEGSIYNLLQNDRGVLAAKLANKREKAGGDGGFTVSLRQPLTCVLGTDGDEEEEARAPKLVSTC